MCVCVEKTRNKSDSMKNVQKTKKKQGLQSIFLFIKSFANVQRFGLFLDLQEGV